MRYIFRTLFIVCFLPTVAMAQTTLTGKVLDDDGNPLPGASILEEGTTNGVVTDFDGNYSIDLSTRPVQIIISYIGFTTKMVAIENQATLDVTLSASEEQLNEVVIIGYGQVERDDVTGAVSTVAPREDAVAQNQSVEQLLQGKAPGVLVQSNGFEPGAPTSIRIRGLNSLTSNTEPLYVIDGIIVDSATEDTSDPLSGGSSYLAPQGGIAGINPRDIESIEILKDASATAIYGSRGANGVVIITTKSGKKGDVKFNYTTTTRIGTVVRDIDVLKTREYVNYRNDTRANQGFTPSFYIYGDGSIANFEQDEQYMLDNASSIPRLQGVDWSRDTYKPAVYTNHRLSLSGGGDLYTYYIAGGYTDNEGLIPNTYGRRTDFTANVSYDLNSKLSLKGKIGVEHNKNSASKGTDNLGNTNNNLVRQIINGVPFLDFEDNNFGLGETSEAIDGPRAWIQDYDDLSKDTRFLGSLSLDYDISDVFTYRAQLGTDYREKERKVWYGTAISRGAQANGEAGIANLNRFRYNIDNTLMFTKKLGKAHKIDGTVGFVIDQRKIQQTSDQASDFPNKDLRADGISFGQVFQKPYYQKEGETILSYLGRINYTLQNKYLFTATFRADGSSKFAPGNRWGYFPAFAFAWKMQKEKFAKDWDFLSNAKLRLGWGLTGNQNIPNYRTIIPYDAAGSPYSDGDNGALTAVVPTNLANPGLTWETTSQYNAGIDLGFLRDRFTATVDVYYKNISDLLLNVEIGPSTGYENYYANQGNLINKGIEVGFSGDIIKTEKFTWNLYGNISVNRNKIDKLGIPLAPFGTEVYSAFLGRQISGGNYFKVPANIFIEGEAPGLFYGFKTNGIVSDESQLEEAPAFRGRKPQLGDVYLVDQNGDGNITDADLTVIGDPNPDFNYGFGSSFSYADFSLSFFFNGVTGNDIANANLLRDGYADNNSNNIRAEAYRNAWSPDNVNGTYPRVGYDLAADTGFTDRIVEDGSYLRLNYVTLGYNLPVDELKFLEAAYLSVSAQNLLLFTKYSGFDPEVNSYSFDPTRVGIDYNSFPNQRSYSVSLNVTF
ncbi:MAG: hypothetical protein CL868_16525 [Cytophagaceae bacterium]|nr:hypothetical protein [Cytophagaceae bacterium]|tara:strand:+ start:1463 stop:4639 length:3177 start_codon:yes stop_codon:yes gene_type:complete